MTLPGVNIFVPNPTYLDQGHMIDYVASGSAIVGTLPMSPDVAIDMGNVLKDPDFKSTNSLWVYYEGNIYNAENLIRFVDKVHIAATRLIHWASVTSKMKARAHHLTWVGVYIDPIISLSSQSTASMLADWLNVPTLDHIALNRDNPFLKDLHEPEPTGLWI